MAGNFLDQKKAQAIKLLGKGAKFPKEKGDFGKLIKDVDDKGKAFFKITQDFFKTVLDLRGSVSGSRIGFAANRATLKGLGFRY